jgi:LPXTG-site transpeptidase (sortase) family protein
MIVRFHVTRRRNALPRLVSHVLIAAGMVMLTIVVWSETESALYQAAQARYFEARVREAAATELEPPGAPAPLAHPARPSTVLLRQLRRIPDLAQDPLLIGRLEIPRLGLSAMVREGVDPSTLRKAVGHLPGTAMPGQSGNFVIAGHRDGFFRGLRLIRKKDKILLRTPTAVFSYDVKELSVVDPTDSNALQSTVSRVCTLVTCFPFDYFGPAPRRFIVRAEIE